MLVAKIRRCGQGQNELDKESVRHNLLTAIEDACPNVHLKVMNSEKCVSIAYIKDLVIAEEELGKEVPRRVETSAMVAKMKAKRGETKKKVTFKKPKTNANLTYVLQL